MDMSQFSQLLTTGEVAKILRIDQSTVRRWIKSGELNAIQLKEKGMHSIYRIPLSAVQQKLQNLGQPQ